MVSRSGTKLLWLKLWRLYVTRSEYKQFATNLRSSQTYNDSRNIFPCSIHSITTYTGCDSDTVAPFVLSHPVWIIEFLNFQKISFHIASDGNYVDEDKSYYALEGVVLNEKFTEDPKKYFEKKLMTAIFRKIWSKLSTKLDGLANMHTGNQIFIQILGILNIQNTWSPTSNCTIFFQTIIFPSYQSCIDV